MSNDQYDENNIERRQNLRHDDEAFRLHHEEKLLETAKRNTTYIGLANSILWLAGMIEILLGIRFFLRLLGANPQNEFAQLINNLSAPFIAPFSTLFPSSNAGANILDVNIVIAIVAYALLSTLLVSLIRFIFYYKP